jgi:GNAT superfamily N-acetyltransferase
MWKECFGDTEEFMELYFSRKYRNGDTLVYMLDGRPVASLQMHPYRMTFYGGEIVLYYLSGIATLPQHRGKGYASSLIVEAHREARRRGAPLTVLIPASEELYGYYARFGYEKVFEAGGQPIPLGEILDSSAGMEEAYCRFDAIYRGMDFCVQKSFDDFAVIADDYIGDGRPVKTDLDGAACLTDPMPLLRIYAAHNPSLSFTLHLKAADGRPEIFYGIGGGNVSVDGGGPDGGAVTAGSGVTDDRAVVDADRRLLAKLLLGYKTGAMPEPYRSLFPEHHPVMNLMLE